MQANEICVGKSELRPIVGEKEVVIKECANEDCCVGERENDRKENMVIERDSCVVAANILVKLLCVCIFVLGDFF